MWCSPLLSGGQMMTVHPHHFRCEFPPNMVLCEEGNKEPQNTGTSRGVPQAINSKPMRKVLTNLNHPVTAMDTVGVQTLGAEGWFGLQTKGGL